MQSLFRPFSENFEFLETYPFDFYKIGHSHFTPKNAPACTMAAKSNDWDQRNMAKFNPKMIKKQPFLTQKLSILFERNFLQSLYTY